jgi:hypothetical protein
MPDTRPNRPVTIASFVVLLCALPGLADPAGEEFFEKKIRPVLIEHCYRCHSTSAEKLKGELLLDTREGMLKGGISGKPAVVPGQVERSLLIEAIRYENEDVQMPPKKRLKPEQVRDFEHWVQMGAPGPQRPPVTGAATPGRAHWAFQPVRNPPVPAVKDPGWPRTSVDAFILAKLEQSGLRPAPQADRRTLARRLYYDLHGLPPTFEQIHEFVNDTSPSAYERLLERLLASPRYGERWGRRWLDLARYADTKGYVYDREEKRFVHAHNYRDWVIRAFNQDMPYDRFLTLQIAADQLVTAETQLAKNASDDLAAMGFLTIGRRFLGIPHDIIDDRIDVVTRTTQALTVACARCHDHKFDPIPAADYYSLYGVFASSMEQTVPIGAEPQQSDAYTAYVAELKSRTEKYEKTIARHREAIAERLRSQVHQYFLELPAAEKLNPELFYETIYEDTVNPIVVRQWYDYVLRGKNRFHPIFTPWMKLAELPPRQFAQEAPAVIDRLLGDSRNKVNGRIARALATTRPASMKDVAEMYGAVFDSAYQAWKRTVKADPRATALPDADEEAIRQVLYAADSPAQIPPGTMAETEHFFTEKARVEIGKARMLIDQLHITAPGARRQAVILVDKPKESWASPRVFRRGNPALKGEEVPRQYLSIIEGPDRKPFTQGAGRLDLARAIVHKDNPLTARVMANRIWQWHFGSGLVRTPSDFGLRAEPPTHPELLDHLATHFVNSGWSIKAMHRLILLSATYRQASAPAAAGPAPAQRANDPDNHLLSRFNPQRLDFESLRDSLLMASGELDLTLGGRPVELFKPPYSTRRTVYGFTDRQFVPGVMKVFDFANPDLHSPQRFETSIPQQSLFFLNSPFVAGRARALARRTGDRADARARIQALYRIVFQREPSDRQLSAGLAFIQSAGPEPQPSAPRPVVTQWSYGYGEFDESTQKLKRFTKLPHFNGTAWQGGADWPDGKLGWVQITATGGHAGNDLAHAAVLRWTAPRNTTVIVRGNLGHAFSDGDGVRGRIVSSRHGQLAMYVLHNRKADTNLGPVELKAGDTIDFVVDIRGGLNNDQYTWTPVIVSKDEKPARATEEFKTEWDAQKEFAGPLLEPAKPLTAWEKYAQVLLSSNEFMFVD